MEKSAVVKGNFFNGNHHDSPSSISHRQVSYRWMDRFEWPPEMQRCGTCGYELNLSSSNRNTSTIGSKYGKSIKRGIISFFYVDESRFTQVDEFHCVPPFSKNSWGLFRRRTKLLCRKCGNFIGTAYTAVTSDFPLVSDGGLSSGNGVSTRTKYDVKIRALQPSTVEQSRVPLYT